MRSLAYTLILMFGSLILSLCITAIYSTPVLLLIVFKSAFVALINTFFTYLFVYLLTYWQNRMYNSMNQTCIPVDLEVVSAANCVTRVASRRSNLK